MTNLCDYQPHGRQFRCVWCGNKRRQKVYRNCPALQGVGDVVSATTKYLGFKECGGCDKRKKWLNWLFPFRKRYA